MVPTYRHHNDQTLQLPFHPFATIPPLTVYALISHSLNMFTSRYEIFIITHLPTKGAILYFPVFPSVPHSTAQCLAHSRCSKYSNSSSFYLPCLWSCSILFMALTFLLTTVSSLTQLPEQRSPSTHFLLSRCLA